MPTQFNRVAIAKISNLDTGVTITVTGLRIAFSVNKTDKIGQSTAKIQIYNLSRDSRDKISPKKSEKNTPRTHIELLVGYEGDDPVTLFKGLGIVYSTFKAPDWVTTLDCNDGGSQVQVAFERTYEKGTEVKTIVSDMLKKSGIPLGEKVLDTIKGSLKHSRSFSGSVTKSIDELQEKFGFKLDVQDEKAVSPPKNVQTQKAIANITPNSGLINSPVVKANVILFRCLINANIKPSFVVSLSSPKMGIAGKYKILKVNAKGDNWSERWDMDVEVELFPVVPEGDYAYVNVGGLA